MTQKDGFTQFYRFTVEQEQMYRDTSPADFYLKTFATAGIRLAFVTDSPYVQLRYRLRKASSRSSGWFDVTQNGVLVDHFGGDATQDLEGERRISLSPGEKKVEIWFPWSVAAELGEISIADGASLLPCKRRLSGLSFGDSITQGYDAQFPSLSYHSQLCSKLDMDGINKAIGGEKFVPALLDGSDRLCPDLITVAYGTNDWSKRDAGTFEENCRLFLQKLTQQYPGKPVYVITPVWRADWDKQTPFGGPLWDAVALMEQICKAFADVVVLRGDDFMPQLRDFFADGYLHPNDMGFGLYSEKLYTAISKAMAERTANIGKTHS